MVKIMVVVLLGFFGIVIVIMFIELEVVFLGIVVVVIGVVFELVEESGGFGSVIVKMGIVMVLMIGVEGVGMVGIIGVFEDL